MLNAVAIEGCLARPAEVRVLPSGGCILSLELTVRQEGCPTETVPVVWSEPPAWATVLDADERVVVVGRVRRRFYRAKGATQSRTEVVAEVVVRSSSRRRARRALCQLSAQLEAAAACLDR